MISLVHKTLFVHIPKCGGQSIEAAFLTDQGLHPVRHRPLLLCFMKPDERYAGRDHRLGHLRAREYPENYISPELFERFFKFALVRNPYAKVVSHFTYSAALQRMGFAKFVTGALPRLVKKNPFFATQSEFLLDDQGAVAVDAVYKLEEIAQHWPEIQSRTGLTAALPHRNRSKLRPPIPWTAEAHGVVAELYAEDFARLGYDPESVPEPS